MGLILNHDLVDPVAGGLLDPSPAAVAPPWSSAALEVSRDWLRQGGGSGGGGCGQDLQRLSALAQ